jgi:hypothetical protein
MDATVYVQSDLSAGVSVTGSVSASVRLTSTNRRDAFLTSLISKVRAFVSNRASE